MDKPKHVPFVITYNLASHADVLRGSSRVHAPQIAYVADVRVRGEGEKRESGEKGKGPLTLSPQSHSLFPFLPTALPLSAPAGAQVQIIGEPIGAVEVKVLTSQTHTYKLGKVL